MIYQIVQYMFQVNLLQHTGLMIIGKSILNILEVTISNKYKKNGDFYKPPFFIVLKLLQHRINL